MGLNSFSRKERLKKNSAIKTVLDNGVCYKSKSINVYILRKPSGDANKAAFICKKNLHQKKSVIRNRVRRILREAILMLERVVKEKAERERNKSFPG